MNTLLKKPTTKDARSKKVAAYWQELRSIILERWEAENRAKMEEEMRVYNECIRASNAIRRCPKVDRMTIVNGVMTVIFKPGYEYYKLSATLWHNQMTQIQKLSAKVVDARIKGVDKPRYDYSNNLIQ